MVAVNANGDSPASLPSNAVTINPAPTPPAPPTSAQAFWSEPDNAVLRAGHRVYFRRLVPVIGGALSDREAYAYLPRSMAYLPPPAELLGMLRGAGFPDAQRIQVSGCIAQLMVGTRR